jgi:hypothetical protein
MSTEALRHGTWLSPELVELAAVPAGGKFYIRSAAMGRLLLEISLAKAAIYKRFV